MLRHAAIGSAAPRDQAYGQYPASQCAHAGRNFGIAASAVRGVVTPAPGTWLARSEEHTSELQSLMRISYAVFCLKKKIQPHIKTTILSLHDQEPKIY